MNIDQIKIGDTVKHPYFRVNGIVTEIGESESTGQGTDLKPVKLKPVKSSGPDYSEHITSFTLAFHEDGNGEFTYPGLLKAN
jgi:hypothetical protein